MVQASTLLVAALAVAPVLSAPLNVKVNSEPLQQLQQYQQLQQRSVDDVDSLDLRDPKFSFGKMFRTVTNVVKKVAVPAASLLLRDEDGNLIERELDLSDLSDLDARNPDPKFNFGKVFRTGMKIAGHAARILLRDEDGNIYVRDVDLSDLSERELLALQSREPFSFGRVFRKVGGVVKKAANVAGTVANVAGSLGLRELEDADELDARDLYILDLSELSERDIADLDIDLESREPIRFRNIINTVGNVAGKASNVAGHIGNIFGSLGFRDLDEVLEYDARDDYYAIEDLD